jgi:hypothetical protein
MSASITVTFGRESDESQITLATLDYKLKDGRIPVMSVGEPSIRLPDGSSVTITSCWDPKNNMISMIVFRNGQIIGHAGSCWHLGDPYLGVQVEHIGFLHLYCQRDR